MPGMETAPAPTRRLASVDAYRGLVMFLLLAECLRLGAVAKALPDSAFWRLLAFHQSHVEWAGCSLHDLIQPSFSFLVGVSAVLSLARRRDPGWRLAAHTLYRAAVLVLLGVFLRSVGRPQTNWTFEDTLTQIGLGYPVLVWLGLRSLRVQLIAIAGILVGYWLLFALWPLPGPDFDWPTVGVPADWPHHPAGFAAHWDKNSNPAWAFDVWFLNLFPRPRPFTFNGGGYATLSFIPTLATMSLGLVAGRVLTAAKPVGWRLGVLAAAGVGGLAAGWLLGELGVCPVVKRIWTPSWTLFSGGWCFLLLAGFAAATDFSGYTGWSFPLRVIGANSIAAYLMEWLVIGFVRDALYRHLGKSAFQAFGPEYEPLVAGAGVLAVLWLVLFALYRRRIFLRI